MPARLGGWCGVGFVRWMRLGGIRSGHASGRRKLRVSARSLRGQPSWTTDVVSFHLADSISGAAEHFIRRAGIRRLLEICYRENSRPGPMDRRSFVRRQLQPDRGAYPDRARGVFALSPHHHHRENLDGPVDHRAGHDFLADLWRRHPFRCGSSVHLSCWHVEPVARFLFRAGSRQRAIRLLLSGLLQRLQSGRRNEKPREKYSSSDFHFDHRDRDFISGDADQHFECDSLAGSAKLAVPGQPVCRKNVWTQLGGLRNRLDPGARLRFYFFGDAGILARALRGGAGR